MLGLRLRLSRPWSAVLGIIRLEFSLRVFWLRSSGTTHAPTNTTTTLDSTCQVCRYRIKPSDNIIATFGSGTAVFLS